MWAAFGPNAQRCLKELLSQDFSTFITPSSFSALKSDQNSNDEFFITNPFNTNDETFTFSWYISTTNPSDHNFNIFWKHLIVRLRFSPQVDLLTLKFLYILFFLCALNFYNFNYFRLSYMFVFHPH